ncbi:MAG TPA: peptidase P60 [Thermopetrobacter sp.]|nr:peptidase P60 [Thermopetrobacter sp.]
MTAHPLSPIERARVVTAARRWLGTPYVHQASCEGAGCDCLGLIRGVWRELIGPEPERPPAYTPLWAEEKGEETMLRAAHRHLHPLPADRPPAAGDVLLFRLRPHLPAKHAAIASRPDTMIHALEGCGVVEVPIDNFWRRQLTARFAFPAFAARAAEDATGSR